MSEREAGGSVDFRRRDDDEYPYEIVFDETGHVELTESEAVELGSQIRETVADGGESV